MITEILQIGTFVLAIIASTVALLTYRRNKKIELQNQLHKIKIDSYVELVYEIGSLLDYLIFNIYKLKPDIEEKIPESDMRLRLVKFADGFDEIAICCSNKLIAKAPFFLEKSSEAMLEFNSKIFEKHIRQYIDGKVLSELEQHYETLLFLANNAINAMREELKIDSINKDLLRRVI